MLSLTPVADASTVVNYSVYAYSSGYNSGGSYRTDVTNLGGGNTRVYGSATLQGGGYYVVLPPNVNSGYLIVAGYAPIWAARADGTGWTTASGNSFERLLPYAFLTSDVTMYLADRNSNTSSAFAGDTFNGIIHIPSHSTTLYLVVAGYPYTTLSGFFGVQKTYNAVVHFIPDPDVVSPDYTSILESINAGIQSVYQALLTNGQTESAISDKLVEMANTLQSVLSALQSSGGDVSGIASALNDVNSKLQSTLDQITSSGVDDEYTQQILDDMDELMNKIDDLTQQIEENTNRPPPEDIVPSIPPQLLPPTDETAIAGRDAISGILSSSFFVTFLLMVFSLAFLRYVLFGKSK